MKNFSWLLISILFANSLLSMKESQRSETKTGAEIEQDPGTLTDEQLVSLQELAQALVENMRKERARKEKEQVKTMENARKRRRIEE